MFMHILFDMQTIIQVPCRPLRYTKKAYNKYGPTISMDYFYQALDEYCTGLSGANPDLTFYHCSYI